MLITRANIIKYYNIATPIGAMIAIADNNFLYLLEFLNQPRLTNQIAKINLTNKLSILAGENNIIKNIKYELKKYFLGELKSFNTPIYLSGTNFQKLVWQNLLKIPYGETISYAANADNIGKAKAIRAAASANGQNPIAILLPCHRVIAKSGGLGGYSGGLERKAYLLEHEKKYKVLE